MHGGPTPLDWQIFLEASTIYSSFYDRPFDCGAIKQTDGMNIAGSSTAVSSTEVLGRLVERSGRRRVRRDPNYPRVPC